MTSLGSRRRLLRGANRRREPLKQPLDLAFIVEVDRIGGGNFREPRHRHDLTGHDDDELGPSRKPQLADRHDMGSVENEYCVFAMHTGRCRKPAASRSLNCVSTLESQEISAAR